MGTHISGQKPNWRSPRNPRGATPVIVNLISALREIRTAIDAYKQASDEGRIPKRVGESGYPKRLEDLVQGVEDEKSPKRERMYFLRRRPRDPFGPNEASAALVAKRLMQQGFKRVRPLAGGIDAWVAAGYQVGRPAEASETSALDAAP